MRIDPNSQSPEAVQSNAIQDAQKPAPQKAEQDPATAAAGGVQVRLSTAANQVAALTQQAVNAPEVRTDRVQALQQAIRTGNYNVTNEQVAAAIYSETAAKGAKE
ncbi:MAG TPA: flagellar biosynthesis anti-sigma factor FlgM [Candidatus Baltobacteraceae bacterium]|nr:flagellar biosynthesis anti-sigma factor FlgM [Candidatus Baltobacteraceae bacterium]